MVQEVDYLRTAKQSNVKALQYAFRDRRNKKELFDHYGFQESQQL
jgi:ribosomal protein L20